MRRGVGFSLLFGGIVVILLLGPEHGVNGFSLLGVVLGAAGLGTLSTDL